MNDYHDKINRITELGVIGKTLTPEAMVYLKDNVTAYMERKGNDLEVVLPFIIGFVYNESYSMAVNDVLKILREVNE